VDSDEALYARIKQGDMLAFDALYERYETRLFGFLYAQIQNRADAEDAFHEAFLSALKSPIAHFERGGFRAWLYRVARNLTVNRARTQQRGARALAQLPNGQPTHAASPNEALEEHELERALEVAIARLPPALSEVFHLRRSGLSYDEIASVLEIPLGTLKSRMHQMVTHLREELRPWTAG
jgi:RNA polymerase sigma-70 factor (ECF subfamily)